MSSPGGPGRRSRRSAPRPRVRVRASWAAPLALWLVGGCVTEGYVDARVAETSGPPVAGAPVRTAPADPRQAGPRQAQPRAAQPVPLPAGPAGPEILSETVIVFAAASVRLTDEQAAVLAELAGRLRAEGREVYLEIGGFTDSSGGERANDALGMARAASVYNFLATQGVPLNRMGIYSHGEGDPVGDNATPEGRAQNRRVVISVLG